MSGGKRPVLIVAVVLLICCAGAVLLYAGPPGEAGDYKRLVRQLSRQKAFIVQGTGHQAFPSDDPEEAQVQLEAIEAFIEAHPGSAHIDALLDDFVLPAVPLDVTQGGFDAGGNGFAQVWDIATRVNAAAATPRPDLVDALVKRIADLPEAGDWLAWKGRDRGDKTLEDRGRALAEEGWRKAMLTRRRLALRDLKKVAAPTPAQAALRSLLSQLKAPYDGTVLEVTGGPSKQARDAMAAQLRSMMARHMGLTGWPPDHTAKGVTTVGRLTVAIEPKPDPVPVTVVTVAQPVVTSSKKLTWDWDNMLQRWESKWETRTEVKAGKAGGDSRSYPALTAAVTLDLGEAEPPWRQEVHSRWVFAASDSLTASKEIAKGSEVYDASLEESARNLGARIAALLLGE